MAAFEMYSGSIVSIMQEIRGAANLEGMAVVDLAPDAEDETVLYSVGESGTATISTGRLLITGQPTRPTHLTGNDFRPLLACPWVMPPGRPGGLLMWRAPRAIPWTQADHGMATALALLLKLAIGTAAGQIGIDHLTGVPNRRWFLEEASRRAERLDHDGGIASLSLIDIDDLRRINTHHGRDLGDRMLIRLANQLRSMVRPGDLIARVGADEFAVWQDNVDHLTAAERAHALCTGRLFQGGPEDVRVTLSIGIVSRVPDSADDVRSLLRRAYLAAREVKECGGGNWRVSQPDPLPRCSRRTE